MALYEELGIRTVINAKGPATRLSGGLMRAEVAAAMVEASQACVDYAELQAAASCVIAEATRAEAGYVASGAAACLLLATAACMARLDPGRMARLPDARGMRNEVVMVRSQRNFYDHAVRAAGATIIEVGLPDRYAGAGVRDAEAWEIEDAIGERTAAVFYVADAEAQPPLAAIVAAASRRGVPVIVDAAAQLPPQSNLRRFIGEGADLVAFSGGKAIGGPQASGFLCGRRELVMSAALQHLDLDIHDDLWEPPASLIDRTRLKGIPPHGIGRTCKAGKEEIVGLLTALRLFVAEGDDARHRRWMDVLRNIRARVGVIAANLNIENDERVEAVPLLRVELAGSLDAGAVALALQRRDRPVYVDASLRPRNVLLVNPVCISDDDVPELARALSDALVAQ